MAIRAAAEALDALSAKLLAHLRPIPPGHERRYCGVNTRRLAVAPRLAELLRKYPGLVADASPDAILSSLQDARAVDALSHRLGVVRSLLDNTVTLTRADAWQISSEVYNAASGKAKTSATMAEEVAPIRAALKTGDRIDTTARRVAVATHVASKVQAKATTAQQKADAARASHARATEARTARRKAKGP